MKYYNKEGQTISGFQWMNLCSDSYRIIKETEVGHYNVSTTWVGIDQRRLVNVEKNKGAPLIFKTEVISRKRFKDINAYTEKAATQSEALLNHEIAIISVTDKGPLWAISEMETDG